MLFSFLTYFPISLVQVWFSFTQCTHSQFVCDTVGPRYTTVRYNMKYNAVRPWTPICEIHYRAFLCEIAWNLPVIDKTIQNNLTVFTVCNSHLKNLAMPTYYPPVDLLIINLITHHLGSISQTNTILIYCVTPPTK